MDLSNFKKKFIKELKKLSNYEDLKHVDKKIVISVMIVLFILIIGYYYILFNRFSGIKEFTQTNNSNNIINKLSQSNGPALNRVSNTNVNFYSSMKASNIIKSNVSSTAIIDKIPAKHMNPSSIPINKQSMFIDIFDVLYDYFSEIKSDNFENAIKYIDKNFIAEYGVNADNLKEYYSNTYYNNFSFFIKNVTKLENLYVVELDIYNDVTKKTSFNTIYKLVENDDKLTCIRIDPIVNYLSIAEIEGNNIPGD